MNLKSILAVTTLSALATLTTAGAAQSHEAVNTSALYASPLAMGITSGMIDFPVISGAYEHRISGNGYSLFVPLHGGFNQNQRENTRYAFGAGLGLRKYLGESFTGSYLTAQTDLLSYKVNKEGYTESKQDENGMWSGGQYFVTPYKGYLSISQLAYGYKWGWRQFTLDLSIGGAFYAERDEKFTNVIGGVNVGFPFNKKTFGL
jgi:hypothetical protein